MSSAFEASELGFRYGRVWALRNCSFEIPAGRVVGLVGPNGAGKTTLLQLAVGLLRAETGHLRVLGISPGRELPALLHRVGFLAQERPLYRGFTIAETLEVGRRLNRRWDESLARHCLARLGVPLERKVGQLSLGERAQVALAMVLGKRPELLLLDEPLANLDPLARRSFLQELMAAVAEHRITVVLSSHLISDLERVAEYLLILAGGRTVLSGEIDGLLRTHCFVVGPRQFAALIARDTSVIHATETDRQTSAVVRIAVTGPAPWSSIDGFQTRTLSLEELVLAYLSAERRETTGQLA